MDFSKKTFRNKFVLGFLTVLIPGLFSLNSSAATDLKNDPENVKSVTVNALVMEVNQNESLMIVGEKRILITKSVLGSTFTTDLQDQNGGEIKLNDFNPRERVLVTGFRLPDGAIKAESIKKIQLLPTDSAR